MTHYPDSISVIIPCFQSARFIEETVLSVRQQHYPELEIIIIDDGSDDGLEAIIAAWEDPHIRYCYQENAGVSAARNKGLSMAIGNYIVFLDSDDLMGPGFLQARMEALKQNPKFKFSAGPVETFPTETGIRFGAVNNITYEVLHYVPEFVTCPSNYLIQKSVLLVHQLLFETALSSTADRFFLLQLNQVAQGVLVDKGSLKYRVTENSMSNKLSRQLIEDNERFLQQVEKYHLVPADLKKYFQYRTWLVLGLGFLRTGSPTRGLKYIMKVVMRYPLNICKDALNKYIK